MIANFQLQRKIKAMRKFGIIIVCAFAAAILFHAHIVKAQSSAPPAQNSSASSAAKPATAPSATKPQTATKPRGASTTQHMVLKDQKDKISYSVGMSIGKSFKVQALEINSPAFLQGVKDGMAGPNGKPLMTDADVQATLAALGADVKARQSAANVKEGQQFLAANKSKPGVVTLPDGLEYKVLTEGTGPKPAPTDTVVCNYRGTLIDGTEFDSSYKRGQPTSFPVNHVIKGWTEVLQLMPVGSKWEVYIPADLAYGERGAGQDIGPSATLIFQIELISIKGN
jgi:FKBP-type peptidyl-prolyl cis-trans isomerase FklB